MIDESLAVTSQLEYLPEQLSLVGSGLLLSTREKECRRSNRNVNDEFKTVTTTLTANSNFCAYTKILRHALRYV